MRTIWKYEVALGQEVVLEMPAVAQALSFQDQDGILCLWAEVYPELPMQERRFRIYGTGHEMERGVEHRYIGTAQLHGFVWHLYEVL